MTSIAVYVEGGGDTAASKAALRQGFDELLTPQRNKARAHRVSWRTVMCGGRNAAFDAFLNATRKRAADFLILVVDAEQPVALTTPEGRLAHLRSRDGWLLEGIDGSRVLLMTQCMEAWLVADPDRLAEFYGQGFRKAALPKRQVLDEEAKADIYSALHAATRSTQKGTYGKIRHASEILKRLRPDVVARRCDSFRQLTDCLDAILERA